VPNRYVLKALNEDIWYTDKKPADIKERIDGINADLRGHLETIISVTESNLSLKAIVQNLDAIALLSRIQNSLDAYYKENAVIHLSETLKKISQVVEQEQTPFIYERIGNTYRHYLIDEFQDTSLRQWHNLLPLVDDALAAGALNLIVGDAKQSIYRWRGGDFKQFIDLPSIPNPEKKAFLLSRENTLKRNYKEVQLLHNYRSKRDLVEFNNTLFSYLKEKNLTNSYIQQVFENHKQQAFNDKSGRVEVQFLPKLTQAPDALREKIVSIIHSVQARNIPLGHVAFIARKNKDLEKAAHILLAEGINIVATQSLKLINSVHIRFLIQALTWLMEPNDSIASHHVFQYLQEHEHLSAANHPVGMYKEKSWTLKRFLDVLKLDDYYLDAMDAAQSIEYLAHQCDIPQKDYAFYMRLMDFVHQAEMEEGKGIAKFLTYFEAKQDSIFVDMPEAIDAVHLLTAHKSKGLEFSIVVLLDLTSRNNSKGNFLMVDSSMEGISGFGVTLITDRKNVLDTRFKDIKQDADLQSDTDELNVFYVACTRAESEMYILAEQGSRYYDDLLNFVQSHSSGDNSQWNEDSMLFVWGKHAAFTIENAHDETCKLDYSFFKPWQEKISIHQGVITQILNQDNETSRERGNLLHFILSGVSSLEDLQIAIRELSDQHTPIKNLLLSLYENQSLHWLFDPKYRVINEQSYISKESEIRRPDRVMVHENELWVIDFKYSAKDKPDIEMLSKYRTQLKTYAKDLSIMYPTHKVQAGLLWFAGTIDFQEVEL
jgi:ATP-dependent exoDNAse (exonuclease V) beta subunit